MCTYTGNTDTSTDSLLYAENVSQRRCVKLVTDFWAGDYGLEVAGRRIFL